MPGPGQCLSDRGRVDVRVMLVARCLLAVGRVEAYIFIPVNSRRWEFSMEGDDNEGGKSSALAVAPLVRSVAVELGAYDSTGFPQMGEQDGDSPAPVGPSFLIGVGRAPCRVRPHRHPRDVLVVAIKPVARAIAHAASFFNRCRTIEL